MCALGRWPERADGLLILIKGIYGNKGRPMGAGGARAAAEMLVDCGCRREVVMAVGGWRSFGRMESPLENGDSGNLREVLKSRVVNT